MPAPEKLAPLLDLETNAGARMRTAERLAIIGLLELIRPARTLGLGAGSRECTEWLSRFSGQVVCVDMDPDMLEFSWRSGNVRRMHAGSQEAMIGFASREEHFDFALVTGATSAAMARDDLVGLAALADVVVVHDVCRPELRAGYVEALRQLNVYADLDLVDGCLGADGPAGGLGLVVPTLTREHARQGSSCVPTYDVLAHEHRLESSRGYRVAQAFKLLASLGSGHVRWFEPAATR